MTEDYADMLDGFTPLDGFGPSHETGSWSLKEPVFGP
jgi:hypothetical protein